MNLFVSNFRFLLQLFLVLLLLNFGENCAKAQKALQASYSNVQRIYKLDETQFENLIKYQSIADSLNVLTNHVLTLPITNTQPTDSLPYGHYVIVSATGDQINFKLESKSYFKIQSSGYHGEVWHVVTDQEGRVIEGATLKIKNQVYKFRSDCGCYPVTPNSSNDTIVVSFQEHFAFFKVNVSFSSPDKYKEAYNTYKRPVNSNLRILPGYVAFNQPMYRKNDTVKVKAFLVNEKGKVWKKRKVLVKYTTPDQKTIVVGKVKRQSEGAYTTEFVVPEKFKLGTYNLSFWASWNEVKLRSEMFQIKDYELQPSYNFSAESSQNVYHFGEAVDLILKATDINDLPLLDAKAKVKISAYQLLDFYGKYFFWNGKPSFFSFENEVLFDVAGETVVSFPDTLFPNAKMAYKAEIEYVNDLGSLFKKTVNFIYDPAPNHFKFNLLGDSLHINHFNFGQSKAYAGLRLISMRGNEVVDTIPITTPHREKIDLFNTTYILKDKNNKEIDRINLNQHKGVPVWLEGKRTHDSIKIALVNSLQMPMSYQIFKRQEKIAGGQWQKGDSLLFFAAEDTSLDDYHVIYSIFWHQKLFVKEQIFYPDETKLNVDINQPKVVFPGSNVPVEVTVTDYRRKGVEGANITAYSVNDLFEDIPLPILPYFGRLHKGFLNPFPVAKSEFRLSKNTALTAKQIDDFELRKTPYYNFAYGKNGVGIYQDSIGGDLAELAVYATNMNKRVSIQAVYLNDDPVCINGSSHSAPFTLRKTPGKYDVKIRTDKMLYTIKNVTLIAGESTSLCLNEAFIEGNAKVSYLKIDKPAFTVEEWRKLKSSFLLVKQTNNEYFIEQNGFVSGSNYISTNSFHYDNDTWYYMIGPLKQGKVNLYNKTKDSLLSFDFYPGYLYCIDSSGQMVIDKPASAEFPTRGFKLNTRYSDWNFQYKTPVWNDILLSNNKVKPVSAQTTVAKETDLAINIDNPARFQQLKSFRPKTYGRAYAGGINLKNNSGRIMKWVLLVNHRDVESNGAWFTSKFNYNGIAPGNYDIMVFYTDSSFSLLKQFKVDSNGTNFYRIDSNEIQEPNLKTQIFHEEIIVEANKSPLNTFVHNPLYFDKIHLKTLDSQKGGTVLSGYLVNTFKRPLNGINLVFEQDGKFKYGALTNRDGYFELTDVKPGQYTIKIGNYLPYYVYENLTVRAGVETRVLIGNEPGLKLNIDGYYVAPEERPFPKTNEATFHNGSPSYYPENISENTIYDRDDIQMAPTYSGLDKLSEIQVVNSRFEGVRNGPPNDIDVISYPALTITDSLKVSRLDEYAKTNRLDKATMDLIRQSDSLNRLRNQFRDYGYWVPNMVTDIDGKARFTVQFPDNITRWKTIVPAMTGEKQTGMGIQYAQAFKPLSAHLGMPTFLVGGDSIQLEGKVLNYTNEPMAVKTWFKMNDDTLSSADSVANRFITQQHWFSTEEADTFVVGYGLKMADGYLDGEEREISVLTRTSKQVKGELFLLEVDSVLNITADGTKKSVYVYNKPLSIYEAEIEKLKNYKYGCNEQTASKLKALLLEEKMREALKQPFTEKNTIRTCIDILSRNQMSDGAFGWWGRAPYDLWVTAYVLDALGKASENYKVGNYMMTARLLQSNLSLMQVSDRLTVLNTLSELPYPMDYQKYINGLDTVNLSLQDEFKLIYLKQQHHQAVDVYKVLNTFIERPEGVFWGEQLFDDYINIWPTSALAYKILRNAGGHEALMKQMRDYFLQLNPEGRNTIERATLLDLFLEDELASIGDDNQLFGEVWVNGLKIDTFPYFKAFESESTINIRKSGQRVNVQVNSHTLTEFPKGNDSLLTVKTTFTQNDKITDSLSAGIPITLNVLVNVKEPMSYVLLEIPIPATCIYNSSQSKTNPHETYRENFRHMTAISCANLPVGMHQFQIQLVPRYKGVFNLLPVKVEEMYFPVNGNYSVPRKIVVKDISISGN
jgi:hypothetical protein